MQSIPRLLLLSIAVFLAGCSGFQGVTYYTELQSVERSAQARTQYGEYTLVTEESPDGPQSVYEDALMQATWVFENTSMHLIVENKLPYSIWIPLDKADVVLPNGKRTRLLRGDMGYVEHDDPVPPLIIPSSDPMIESPASASVHLLPRSNVEFAFSSLNTGQVEELIHPTDADADSVAVSKNVGAQFSIMLPIETREAVTNYTFFFEVTGAEIPREEGDAQVLGVYPIDDEDSEPQ